MSRGDIQKHPLHKIIVNALTDCINAHGPITPEWKGSAAKRILNNILEYVEIEAPLVYYIKGVEKQKNKKK